MTDVLTKDQRSYCMSQIRGKNTKLELTFGKEMRLNGLRGFRRGDKLEGKPDFIFPKLKIAVFLDGCFWHGCSKCYKEPKTNINFWRDKITSNKKRDAVVNRSLRKDGWRVKRFWGHRIKKNPKGCVMSLKKFIEKSSE